MNTHSVCIELGHVEDVASMEAWDRFIDFASEHIEHEISDRSRAYKLRLALEELVSNIIRAAAAGQINPPQTQLKVTALRFKDEQSTWLVLRTKDNGIHFDPEFPTRERIDTNQPVHERKIGGLGLFLIRESVDRVAYEWLDGKNVYELWMKS
jgi:anti-sigma regulatory factor (Ser/Thr protein kinase)